VYPHPGHRSLRRSAERPFCRVIGPNSVRRRRLLDDDGHLRCLVMGNVLGAGGDAQDADQDRYQNTESATHVRIASRAASAHTPGRLPCVVAAHHGRPRTSHHERAGHRTRAANLAATAERVVLATARMGRAMRKSPAPALQATDSGSARLGRRAPSGRRDLVLPARSSSSSSTWPERRRRSAMALVIR
jgi:hypothetical protein